MRARSRLQAPNGGEDARTQVPRCEAPVSGAKAAGGTVPRSHGLGAASERLLVKGHRMAVQNQKWTHRLHSPTHIVQ